MSERLKSHEDSQESQINNSEQLEKISDKLEKAAEKAPGKAEQLEQLGKKLESFAEKDKEKSPIATEKKPERPEKIDISSSHKAMTYKATMRRVESKLPPYQRAFSKLINNDKVDTVSNIASKTVARPSGILGGGITALVGLAVVTYYANKIGFTLSGSEFIALVAVGWLIGLSVEFLVKSVKKTFL